MEYTLSALETVLGGEAVGSDRSVRSVVTDSRVVSETEGAVFAAIRSDRRDGHDFIPELVERGFRAFIVQRDFDTASWTASVPGIGFLRVDDTLAALQRWAAWHRRRSGAVVVGITGSNGKTVVKEWFAQLWDGPGRLFRSPKSYNSQLGVALSLLMMEGTEEVAVIEAGISEKGEMERLERMIAPRVGLLTNIGPAHQENFASLEEKLQEKLVLFRETKTIVCRSSLAGAVRRLYPEKRLFTWGEGPGADLRLVADEKTGEGRRIGIAWGEERLTFILPFADEASFEDALHAVALTVALGRRPDPDRLARLRPVAMRLELKNGINGCRIVNDAYTSDVRSLAIALDSLNAAAGGQEKWVILSDIPQTGLEPGNLYREVAQLLRLKGVDGLIGIGPQIAAHASLFAGRTRTYESPAAFLAALDPREFRDRSVLIKGGREFQFERIGRALEEKIHTTTLEVNLDALVHNLNYYRSLLPAGVRVMAMVKAGSYGHGTHEIAAALQHQRVDYLGVAFADEGVALRGRGITLPIVVLNPDPVSFPAMIEHRLEPEVYSFSSLEAFVREARRQGETRYPVHVKLDTGMHRLGFDAGDMDRLCERLRAEDAVAVESVFSHFASSDLPGDDAFTRMQIARFEAMGSVLRAAFPERNILRHICNSAGIERFPEAHYDMVRLGVGLYGISPFNGQHLRPVASLKSIVVQVKDIPAGETVGYCRRGVLQRPSRIAVIPVGYADGLDRALGNGNWSVSVAGRPVPIVGNICMDTCMIDVTGLEVREGDTVVVFGESPTALEMAGRLGTIPYEVFTSVSSRVKRVFVKE